MAVSDQFASIIEAPVQRSNFAVKRRRRRRSKTPSKDEHLEIISSENEEGMRNESLSQNYSEIELETQISYLSDDSRTYQAERIWDESVIRHALLYRAALMGKWEDAEAIFSQDSAAIVSKINLLEETALHVAVGTGNNLDFVEKLVKLMCERSLSLELQDSHGNTALAMAAIVGNVEAAKILVSRNEELPSVKNKLNYSPLLLAAKYGHRDIILYLLTVTNDEEVFTAQAGARLLNFLITFDFYDIALDILYSHPILAIEQDHYGVYALQMIAEKPDVFETGTQLGFWQRLLNRCWCGIVRLLDAFLPKQGSDVENPLENSNNTGELVPSSKISGAALQFQRELQWFKEVEKLVQPSYRSMKNKDGKTPRMIFSERHEGLVHQGEKWMKITASSCTVVAALIATVAFTAIFTVPGGNDNDQGIPIFLYNKSFMVFAAADALALITSSASVMMFLGILTSRYAEDDFLRALPTRLIIGLVSLFISISSMVAAFGASFYLVLVHQMKLVWVPVIVFAFIPVVLFALSQFPLLVQMISSTFGRSIFGLQSMEVFL
ncbi:ankyrin repeat-containing protein ITN1-like [Benincasa hispida]|uniref:ankyrin repeat-containing protein ITN1-like n=1 Tax=Benincasa hispida TaxID=102211 RepID=UPI0018FF7086|nr:ankyrin repeat-containing protein ITN1-like [Benincasa hispida]